jgi:hypothetical protein
MLAPRVKDAREETEGRRSSRQLLTMVLKTARRPSRDVRRDPLQFDVGRRDSVAVQGRSAFVRQDGCCLGRHCGSRDCLYV